MKIDSSTQEGKSKIAELLVNAVINQEPEYLTGDYKVNEVAQQNYMDALTLLAGMQKQGKCSFTYDLWYKPYALHCIYLTWNVDANEDGLPEYSAKEIADLIGKFNTLQLDKTEPFTWQLSSEIYIDTQGKTS